VDVASIIVSSILAALVGVAAVRKLTHAPDVVASYAAAGVPEEWLNRLAVLLLSAATGLVLGHWWAPAGIAAAGGLVGYFAVAVAFHVRAGDSEHVGNPTALGVVAVVALVLRILVL
jgi:DoxX-like family